MADRALLAAYSRYIQSHRIACTFIKYTGTFMNHLVCPSGDNVMPRMNFSQHAFHGNVSILHIHKTCTQVTLWH